MNKNRAKHSSTENCANCGAIGLQTVFKDKRFGQVAFVSLPIRHCSACGESYYEPEVSQRIDEMLAHSDDCKELLA